MCWCTIRFCGVNIRILHEGIPRTKNHNNNKTVEFKYVT